MTFGEYTKLSGLSHSFLKNNGRQITPTEKMSLGSEVHNYLLEPETYEPLVSSDSKMLAGAIIKVIGTKLWLTMLKEVAAQADFSYNGLTMPWKGRIDLGVYGRIVVDAKVAENVRSSIDYFGYPNQLTGYAMGIEAPAAMILAINAKKALADKSTRDKSKYVEKINVPLVYNWWQEKIINHGY